MSGPLTGQYGQQTGYNSSYSPLQHYDADTDFDHDTETLRPPSSASNTKDIPRSINRTPSPTPSEVEALDPNGGGNLKDKFMKLSPKQRIIYGVVGVILLTLTILISVFNDQIVMWLQPTANKIHNLPAGWLIPVAILFVLSFPPLFGQELILAVVGLTYGIWAGIGIAALGTYLGEVGNFFAFKYLCRSRSKSWENKIDYACLAEIVREGGVVVPIVARYSLLPPHYTTAVFATIGMPFWVFTVSAIVSLPRQFVNVFVGVVLEDKSKGKESKADKIATFAIVAVTIVVTYAAVRYLKSLTARVKPQVIYKRRKARQNKFALTLNDDGAGSTQSFLASQSTVDLMAKPQSVGQSYPPSLHQPQPSYDAGYPAYQGDSTNPYDDNRYLRA